REAGHEDPAPSEEIGGTPTEQQEARGRHRIGADHPLKRLRGEPQVALDRGKRHHDDVLIERRREHREREQRKRRLRAHAVLVLPHRLDGLRKRLRRKTSGEKAPNVPVRGARERVDLPATAAWRHLDARTGFEVLFLSRETDGYFLEGYTAAVEEGEAWAV